MNKYLNLNEKVLKEKECYYAAFEIERQPELWIEGLEIISKNKEKIEAYMNKVSNVDNLKIILTGAGSSAIAGSIVENYIKEITGKEVEFIPTTDIVTNPDFYFEKSQPTLVVSFGSSGSTPESIETVRLAEEKIDDLYKMLIICVSTGTLPKNFEHNEKNLYIPLPDRSKGKSFAATAEFTNLVQYALVLFDIKNLEYYKMMFSKIQKNAEDFFSKQVNIAHSAANKEYKTIISLGSNELTGLASEMALKINELCNGYQPSGFYSTLEFRHGPKLIMNSNILCVFFISNDEYVRKYDIDMMKEAFKEENEATILAISDEYIKEAEEYSDYYIYFEEDRFDYLNDAMLTFSYALALQSIAVFKSLQLGVTPDLPNKEGKVPKVVDKITIYRKKEWT